MLPALSRLPDLRPVAALLWGLALAWPGTPDVDRLRPLCVGAALTLGLAAAVRPPADGLRPMAAFSLGMAALMAWQPLYSTLGYSFLLNLHWQAWLLGLGLMGWQAAQAGTAGPRVDDWLLLAGAVALRLWPGAGMVERHGLAGLTLAAWGALRWLAPRLPAR